MPKLSPASFALSSVFVLACASGGPEPAQPVTDGAPAAAAEKAPPPAASASAASSAAASAAPGEEAPNDRVPEQPFKGESPTGGKKVATKRAWAYWPDYNGIGVFEVKDSTDTKTTFLEFASTSVTFSVPTAFTYPAAAPKQLAKGDLVLATVVTNGICAVVKELKDDKVNVGFLWGQKLDAREFSKEDLLRLNDKQEFGARVLVKDGEAWRLGILVYADKANAWVAGADPGQEDAKVPLADIRVFDVAKRRKKGDKVLACTFETMGCIETTVVGQKHDGLAYDIALPEDFAGHAPQGAKSLEASACSVGSIPKK